MPGCHYAEEAIMITRRTFATLLTGMAGVAVTPRLPWSQTAMSKTVLYASVGPEFTLFDSDIAAAALAKRGTVTLPANIQYAWPHPSTRYFYAVRITWPCSPLIRLLGSRRCCKIAKRT